MYLPMLELVSLISLYVVIKYMHKGLIQVSMAVICLVIAMSVPFNIRLRTVFWRQLLFQCLWATIVAGFILVIIYIAR